MDAEQIKALIEAIKNKDGDAALAIAEGMLVSAASGEAAPAGGVESDPLAASAEPTPPSPEEEELEATLSLLTGIVDAPSERIVCLKKLIEERTKHAERVATLELSSRFELVAELVKLGVEFPSTAFVGDPADRKLVARLSSESITDLRARVAVVKKAKGAAPPAPPTRKDETPATGGRSITTAHGVVTLSASEIKSCEESGAKPEAYAENKAIREAARRKGSK
jgi:hypothetical protein